MKKSSETFKRFTWGWILIFLIHFAGCQYQKQSETVPREEKEMEKTERKRQPAPSKGLKRTALQSLGYVSNAVCSDEYRDFNTEEYSKITENEYKDVVQNPLSTFSIDVDTASYTNMRRFIRQNRMPPKDAIRIEEMINYFSYQYPQPTGKHPFSVYTEIARCPWNSGHKLIHLGIQGKKLDYKNLKPCNLVFLVDSSGSMSSSNKLPLLKKSLKLLLNELSGHDRVAIVAYASAAGLVCPSTPASDRERIIQSLDRLQAGGSTAGGQGIKLAYKIAGENLIKNGNNRVILATDGDFNIGVSSTGDLVRLIEEKRKENIYLTICGFGMGNYKDSRMEAISNAGNGNYFYIDNINEARKVFVTEMRANLFTIAKDVKIQIEFNPAKVKAYRLVGYENRLLAKEDFNDDKKDAGELGAGHTVTALYEIVPAGSPDHTAADIDDLKYQQSEITPEAHRTDDILTLKLRYKPPKKEKSRLIVTAVQDKDKPFKLASENFRFSAAVAGLGMLLRDSKFKGNLNYQDILSWARESRSHDPEGYRSELVRLIKTAQLLQQ